MKFEELNLDKGILKVIQELHFEAPTEIQEKAIPLITQGEDVIGESATGSGKTLAFAIQLIEKSIKSGSVQGLVLVPTRELCEQVSKEIKRFSKYKDLAIVSIYGGMSYNPQVEALENAEIVVGTPGRVLDHIKRDTFDTAKIRILVIDEADRMFDMGFLPDVTEIIRNVPPKRQTLLFSATIDPDVEYIGKKYMHNPKFASAIDRVDPTLLKQYYYEIPPGSKFSLLVYLLKHDRTGLVMVFCNTRKNVDFLSRNLKKQEIEAHAIHGGLTQNQRNKVMYLFKNNKIHVLVASDVAARGLDIKNVSHVYNYDMPKTEDEYIHRIGRTARAGEKGKAISIIAERDYENFHRIKRDERVRIEKLETPKFEHIPFRIHEDEHQRSRYRSESHYNRSRPSGQSFSRPRFGRNEKQRGERGDERGFRGRYQGQSRRPRFGRGHHQRERRF